ncbi:Glycosyltransferase [hydrothermal vent metagenome]|uniref:Glycosyltransferase n=1 Tax=hydrothermal vent metagenome TaxID=652676 RepID=A0A3B1CII7_9ZZZZ
MIPKTDKTDFKNYKKARVTHWGIVAKGLYSFKGLGGYYHNRLEDVYRFNVPEASRILEIGCGQGDLLASLKPSYGVGVDFCAEMIDLAKEGHPGYTFIHQDAHQLDIDEKFDIIILSDLVNDLWDVQAVFEQIRPLCEPHTRIILNFYSRVWEIPLGLARRLRLAKPALGQNWLTVEDIEGLFALTDFEVIKSWQEILLPLPIPGLKSLFNRYLARLWPFRVIDITNFMIVRPQKMAPREYAKPLVSILVPARNEAGNIASIFKRVPEMGGGVELVFVEGGSKDNTYEVIKEEIKKHPEKQCILLKQSGKGKGNAVREGFARATGKALMILDADLTVPPEDLPRFLDALTSNKGEFINGVRLVYPMQDKAMRYINLFGNKFFGLAFSWILGQSIKDTLCGTKVLWKKDYEKIAANRVYFGDFDPFGDFDLIFGAAKLNLKIIDMPIRYRERIYGDTNINRWTGGWLLLKMVIFALRRIKFI